MLTRPSGRLIFALTGIPYLSQAAGGQLISQVRKDQALQTVKVRSIPGWREVTLVEGMLSVNLKRAANGNASIPDDVQKFFESFMYWDVH